MCRSDDRSHLSPTTYPPQVQYHVLEAILSAMQLTNSYQINWEQVTSQCARMFNLPLSVEDAKIIWNALAYNRQPKTGGDGKEAETDDEELFQTKGEPFSVSQFVQYRNHQRCQFYNNGGHEFLSIEYPTTISSIFGGRMRDVVDCDLMRIRSQCPESIVSVKDYSKEPSEGSKPVNRMDSVLEMMGKGWSGENGSL